MFLKWIALPAQIGAVFVFNVCLVTSFKWCACRSKLHKQSFYKACVMVTVAFHRAQQSGDFAQHGEVVATLTGTLLQYMEVRTLYAKHLFQGASCHKNIYCLL